MLGLDAPGTITPAPAFGWTRAAASGCRFRRQTETDLPFLGRLYASTRAEELAPVPWSEAEKAAFLDQQFRAQHAHYQQYYPNTDWLVITHGGEDIGRFYIERWPSQHRIIDIAFMPAHRGRGYGEALLRDAIDEAAAAGKDVSIHVEKLNPAMRLYQRLGFVTEEDKGVYDLMRWIRPGALSSEVDTGSRQENASRQESRARSDSIGTEGAPTAAPRDHQVKMA